MVLGREWKSQLIFYLSHFTCPFQITLMPVTDLAVGITLINTRE